MRIISSDKDYAVDLSKLETYLLAMRDAASAALQEVEVLKASSPQQPGKITGAVERHLEFLTTGKWGKKDKKKQNPQGESCGH